MTHESRTRLFRPRTIVFGVMVALLATTLGATALVAQPKDASVGTSDGPLHPVVDNTSRTADLLVTSTAFVTIVGATMDLGAKSHGCEVSASAEVQRTVDGTGTYVFSVGLDGTASTVSSERRLEFVSTADTDVVWGNAATNQGYDALSGAHTFNFLVRKSSGADTTVTNATITVVCTNRQL
jgi:hypothetical protein